MGLEDLSLCHVERVVFRSCTTVDGKVMWSIATQPCVRQCRADVHLPSPLPDLTPHPHRLPPARMHSTTLHQPPISTPAPTRPHTPHLSVVPLPSPRTLQLQHTRAVRRGAAWPPAERLSLNPPIWPLKPLVWPGQEAISAAEAVHLLGATPCNCQRAPDLRGHRRAHGVSVDSGSAAACSAAGSLALWQVASLPSRHGCRAPRVRPTATRFGVPAASCCPGCPDAHRAFRQRRSVQRPPVQRLASGACPASACPGPRVRCPCPVSVSGVRVRCPCPVSVSGVPCRRRVCPVSGGSVRHSCVSRLCPLCPHR
jgi:hypothetical protein